MARFVILACCIALMAVATHGAAIPAEFQEVGKAARAECMQETGATEEMIEKAAAGNFEDDKCYFKCIYDKFGLIDDGALNFDTMAGMIPDSMKEAGTKMVETCRTTTGKDVCEISFKATKCFFETEPEAFFVV